MIFGKKKLNPNSEIEDILTSVNSAINYKNRKNINESEEDDVLELMDSVEEKSSATTESPISPTFLDNNRAKGLTKSFDEVSFPEAHAPITATATKKLKTSDTLISDSAAATTATLLNQLKQKSVKAVAENVKNGNSITLEELVTNLLKPQLSEWLNNNLPTIVQKVVEAEVKKLTEQEDN